MAKRTLVGAALLAPAIIVSGCSADASSGVPNIERSAQPTSSEQVHTYVLQLAGRVATAAVSGNLQPNTAPYCQPETDGFDTLALIRIVDREEHQVDVVARGLCAAIAQRDTMYRPTDLRNMNWETLTLEKSGTTTRATLHTATAISQGDNGWNIAHSVNGVAYQQAPESDLQLLIK